MPAQFNNHSIDSMLSTLLVRQQADAEAREEFRTEIRERFDRGTRRMDNQDGVLDEIRDHARKTNGRVTRLEDADITKRVATLELAENAIRTELARFKGALWVILGVSGLLEALGLTLLNHYLK
jgi:hypothetical protein